MHNTLRTLLTGALVSLSSTLFAHAAVSPRVQLAQQATNMFAAWTPNQLAKSQNSVDVYIQLPYRGEHNNWTINFSSYDASYSFTTSSSTNPSNSLYLLGDIAEGTYDVTFVNNDSRSAQFEYWVACNNYWVQGSGGSQDKTVYNVSFGSGCSDIYIDANY